MEKPLDLRIVKTYRSLHTAFHELISENDFDSFTVNELCDRATIRRATFYKHFNDKYDYFRHYVHEIWDGIAQSVQSLPKPATTREGYLQKCVALVNYLNEDREQIAHLRASSMYPVLMDILSEMLYERVLKNLTEVPVSHLPEGLDKADIAAFSSGGIINVLLHQMESGKPLDTAAIVHFVEILTPGK